MGIGAHGAKRPVGASDGGVALKQLSSYLQVDPGSLAGSGDEDDDRMPILKAEFDGPHCTPDRAPSKNVRSAELGSWGGSTFAPRSLLDTAIALMIAKHATPFTM